MTQHGNVRIRNSIVHEMYRCCYAELVLHMSDTLTHACTQNFATTRHKVNMRVAAERAVVAPIVALASAESAVAAERAAGRQGLRPWPAAGAPGAVPAAGAILNLLGPLLGEESTSNAKRQGFKKLLSLALTVGMLNDALRPDQTEMDPSASKPTKT